MTIIDDRGYRGKMADQDMKPDRIAFRNEGPADAAVIRRAHASHWHPPPGFDLPTVLPDSLLDQQHVLQERHIAAAHPGADRRMIVADGVAVGRICLRRDNPPWQIIDFALVSDAQGVGIGRIVLDAVKDEAARADAAIILDVARDNARAQAFYHRAGFRPAGGDTGTHFRLVWDIR